MSDPGNAARLAALSWGLPEPQHLRTGMSSLWSVNDDVVLRATSEAARSERWPWLSAQLLDRGIRVPRSLSEATFRHEGWVVTQVEHIHGGGVVDWGEVGVMVRRVHAIEPQALAAQVAMPWCGSFVHWDIERQCGELCGEIDDAARQGMLACMRRWDGWRHVLTEQPNVVCHGDLHPGNVLPTATGPVLIDWDLMCIGPVAWDHAPLLRWEDRWSDRWGGGSGTYDAFAEGYGRSLRDDWVATALAEIRLLVATLMRIRAAREHPESRPELDRRLQWWRGDPDAPRWEPQ